MSSQPTTPPTLQQPTKKPSTLTALSILTVLIAVSFAFFIGYNTNSNTTEEQQPHSETANLFGLKRFFTSTPAVSREISKTASRKAGSEKMSRTPIYFLSHGGVSFYTIFLFCGFSRERERGIADYINEAECHVPDGPPGVQEAGADREGDYD